MLPHTVTSASLHWTTFFHYRQTLQRCTLLSLVCRQVFNQCRSPIIPGTPPIIHVTIIQQERWRSASGTPQPNCSLLELPTLHRCSMDPACNRNDVLMLLELQEPHHRHAASIGIPLRWCWPVRSPCVFCTRLNAAVAIPFAAKRRIPYSPWCTHAPRSTPS